MKATQTIDIQAFVDAREVPITYYARPYYLTPDRGGDKVYALLRETLRRSGRIAIAQFVLRTKQYLAALLPQDDVIVLDTLRYADEIRPAEFELPKSDLKHAGVTAKEVEMAMTLIDGMTEKWNPGQFHNTFKEDVLTLVQKKVKANQSKTITEPDTATAPARRDNVVDLMALLKQSIRSKTGNTAPATAREPATHVRGRPQGGKPPRRSAVSPSKGTSAKSGASSTRTTASRERRASK